MWVWWKTERLKKNSRTLGMKNSHKGTVLQPFQNFKVSEFKANGCSCVYDDLSLNLSTKQEIVALFALLSSSRLWLGLALNCFVVLFLFIAPRRGRASQRVTGSQVLLWIWRLKGHLWPKTRN